MIRSFKIDAPRDENGFYILPEDILYREEVMTNLGYHDRRMKPVKNTMFAIICAVNHNKKVDTRVNGWTEKYVRINGVKLHYDSFFLDEKENILYDFDDKEELTTLQRQLKLKKLRR